MRKGSIMVRARIVLPQPENSKERKNAVTGITIQGLWYGACGFGQGLCQPSCAPPLTGAVLLWAGQPFERLPPCHRKRRHHQQDPIWARKQRRSADTPGRSGRRSRLLNEGSRRGPKWILVASLESVIR